VVIGAYVFTAHAKISFRRQGEREGECESERARRERAMTELLTTAEMAQADRLAIAGGVAGMELMENAGRAVADNVSSRHLPGSRIAVVVGPGNNGGDGLVAARLLRERGYRLRVLLLGGLGRFKGDALQAAHRWNGPCERATPAALTPGEVIVDALFGAGLDRSVEGSARVMIEAMNTGAFVHAVDLPSGINGTTGAVMGAAVRASETITFFRRKLGHVLLPGCLHCGKIHVADIGINANVLEAIKPPTSVNSPSLWLKSFPVPAISGHKYSRGHAVVASGASFSTGAARLAARAALRAGAGLVTIASPREALAVNAAASLAVMVRPVDGADELAEFLRDARRNVVVLGPGGGVGQPMREMVLAALAGERAVVLDADGLTSFADEPQTLIAAIRTRKGATLLTPHEGEFSRLFSMMEDVLKAPSKLDRARRAAARTGAVCLLKGADTVVAAPDGRAAIMEGAPPWLATAGSGDVLAGMAAGLLAQGMAGFEAASATVWLHAQAGTAAGPGLIAEDLPEMMPRIYSRLYELAKARHSTKSME
jgi:ADP-dependent NAD(P)H-hydrate dehydratase / NAD(P)H-hydrate epimerase